jgi:hypothetical protein
MESENSGASETIDGLELLEQLWRECPDLALEILKVRTQENIKQQLDAFIRDSRGEQLFTALMNCGAVLAGSFVLQAFYGKFDPTKPETEFGDLDFWVDVSGAVKGDPRQLLPENHRIRSLSWEDDAAEIAQFYGCYPIPFPYIASASDETFDEMNESRYFHPAIPILIKHCWLEFSTEQRIDLAESGRSTVKTLSDMRFGYECAFHAWPVDLNQHATMLWGEREPPPYFPENSDYDEYDDSITHSFSKADKGIVSSRTFPTLKGKIELHIVDTQGKGLQSWIEEVFDLNLCGAIQVSNRGVYIREPQRIVPLLFRKSMFYTCKSRMLDWTEARREKVAAALVHDNQIGAVLSSTRLGSVNVMKLTDPFEVTFPALFEWAKAVLLPPVKDDRRRITMEELYERMATVKLNRVAKYQRRGFSLYYPGITLSSDDVVQIVNDRKDSGATFPEICRAIFRVFEPTVEESVLERFIHLVAAEPRKSENIYGTGPVYMFF